MRQPIKLIMKKGKVRRDGTNPIFVQYCSSSKQRVLISMGIATPPLFWNKKTAGILETLPFEYGNAQSREVTLREKLRKAEKLVGHAVKKNNACPMRFAVRLGSSPENFPKPDQILARPRVKTHDTILNWPELEIKVGGKGINLCRPLTPPYVLACTAVSLK